jgi:4-amino-4-deoxy-L-arabinose transferase-like glycosyltransferase
VRTERVIVPAGPLAIRFAARPGARLVWSPVGRRGDPEYVPASSLSPDPPERARFGAWAGARPLDGMIAALILLVIAASCLVLARERLRRVPREVWLAFGAVLVIGVVVRWIDLGGFGQTWDEDVNWAAGRNYITNILSLDLSPGSWMWNFEHPPVMKYLAGVGAQFADGFGPARALSAVWIALGCALLVPIGARLYSLRTGILAGGIATLLPQLVGHGQIVGHESPTVLWWSLAIVLALGVCDGEPPRTTRWRRMAAVGIVIGVAAGSRFVAGLAGPVCLAIVVIEAPRPRRLRTFVEGAVIMPAVALATFVALWPRLWLHPVRALHESLTKLTHGHPAEPFLGSLTATPGASYFVVYLIATLPALVLLASAGGIVRAARERSRASLIVLVWLVVPLAVTASPVRQDGIRYVLPCVTALAVFAGHGIDWIGARFVRPAAAVVALYLAITLVRIHPYYIDYFGEQVGGPGTVERHGWFETAWWGEGVAAGVDYVNTHAAPGARVSRNCIMPVHLAWFRQDLWAPMTTQASQADWIVAYAPHTTHCTIPAGFTRVFTETAQGAVLVEVFRR